jgi:hypothetical protein
MAADEGLIADLMWKANELSWYCYQMRCAQCTNPACRHRCHGGEPAGVREPRRPVPSVDALTAEVAP